MRFGILSLLLLITFLLNCCNTDKGIQRNYIISQSVNDESDVDEK